MVNHQLVRQILNRKYQQLSEMDGVFQELANRVISRLDYIRITPEIVLDCGSGYGVDSKLLLERYPNARLVCLDSALNFLKAVKPSCRISAHLSRFFGKRGGHLSLACGDVTALPFVSGSIGLVYSNLLLPYLNDYRLFFQEIARVLKIGGTFCISGLGVDSAKELRELGLSSYIFPDMHDIGDSLVSAGFSNPVVDTEYITLDYENLETLLKDAQNIACGAAGSGCDYLSSETRGNLARQRKLPAKLTLELFVAHGWKDKASFSDRDVIKFMPKK